MRRREWRVVKAKVVAADSSFVRVCKWELSKPLSRVKLRIRRAEAQRTVTARADGPPLHSYHCGTVESDPRAGQ